MVNEQHLQHQVRELNRLCGVEHAAARGAYFTHSVGGRFQLRQIKGGASESVFGDRFLVASSLSARIDDYSLGLKAGINKAKKEMV